LIFGCEHFVPNLDRQKQNKHTALAPFSAGTLFELVCRQTHENKRSNQLPSEINLFCGNLFELVCRQTHENKIVHGRQSPPMHAESGKVRSK
jgi:hypothetical protein